MNRRTLLVAVGSMLAAGCSEIQRGNGEMGAYREGLGQNNGTAVEFDFNDNNQSFDFDFDNKPDFKFNSSQVGSDITFDFGGDQSKSSDALPTPAERNEQATEYLVRARKSLIEAIKIYAGFGGKQIDLTSVSPTTDSFSQYRINSKIDNARQPLRKATQYATEGQKVYILALEQTGIFLKHSTEIEGELQSALAEYQASMDFLYDADTVNYKTSESRLQDHTTEAQEELDLIRSETDSSALQVIDTDAQKIYKAKVAQFDALIQAFRSLDKGITETGSGLTDLKKGVRSYNDRKYEDASFDLNSSLWSFSAGERAFETAHDKTVLQSAMKPGFDFVTVLHDIAEDLNRSAEAKTNNDNDKYVKYREKAIAHLKSDDRTRYMSEINQIQW